MKAIYQVLDYFQREGIVVPQEIMARLEELGLIGNKSLIARALHNLQKREDIDNEALTKGLSILDKEFDGRLREINTEACELWGQLHGVYPRCKSCQGDYLGREYPCLHCHMGLEVPGLSYSDREEEILERRNAARRIAKEV